MRLILVFTLLLALGAASPPAAADISGFAIVREDGTLQVGGHTIRLFGIYIPPTPRSCLTQIFPIRCAPRAVLELDRRLDDFVQCREVFRNPDQTITAVCETAGRGSILAPPDDLSAWMLSRGWALALPDAPFEYTALERIARSQGRGVWGAVIDRYRW